MKKRSKSELVFNLTQENTDLKSKIQRSKPVLQTIYDKVKQKQKFLYNIIEKDKRLITDIKTLANDYKKLYQQSIEILHKSKTIDKFNYSVSNYLKTKPRTNEKQQKKSKSLYEQYRERIDRQTTRVNEQKNPEIVALKRQNEQLKNKMIDDIDKLKLARAKSQRNLQKNRSNRVGNETWKQRISQLEKYKERLVQRQRKKLDKIRQ